jgi:hypothetical protein
MKMIPSRSIVRTGRAMLVALTAITARTAIVALAVVIAPAVARAQSDFTPLDRDGNGVPALRRIVSVHLRGQSLVDALRTVVRAVGLNLVAPGDLPALSARVSVDSDTVAASTLLLQLVEGTGIELMVSPRGRTLAARQRAGAGGAPSTRTGRPVHGSVQDSASGRAITDALIVVEDLTGHVVARARTGDDGSFLVRDAPATDLIVRARRVGFAQGMTTVTPYGPAELRLALAPTASTLSTVVVTPGFYGVMEQHLATRQTLTREQLRAAPQLGEDLFRSVNRLPGISASDFSARFRVRSGANDELYTSLDGLELVEPFHLKDFDGAFSIIDVGAVEGLDLITGGFDARIGNRLTGVVTIRTLEPPPNTPRTTEVALTLSTVRATSSGSFAGDRGGWLFSARRGFLEYALRAAGEESNLNPRYYDVLAKTSFRFGENNVLGLHLLHAGDQLTYQDDETKPRLNSEYASSYAWATLDAKPMEQLAVSTVASVGRLTWLRNGTRTSTFDGVQDLRVRDDRSYRVGGVRQDWQWELSRLMFGFGGELRTQDASYAYDRFDRQLEDQGGIVVPVETNLNARVSPDGATSGGYLTMRVQPVRALTGEAGVRYDNQSYTHEHETSPRLGAALSLSPRLTLRAAWGRYSQPQALYQLQVQDGRTTFDRAELAEHRVAGLEYQASRAVSFRVEGYERRIIRERPRFLSVDNSIDVFPEIEPDGILFAPSGGRARGVEFLVSRSPAQRVAWTVSYALAKAVDFANGVEIPRTLDQRHTVTLDLTWRPTTAWRLSTAWLYHTGWPTTAFTFSADTLSSGTVLVSRIFGPRNADRLVPYHRLDFRASRDFSVHGTRLSAFVDLFNAYGRRNPRGYDAQVTESSGRVTYFRAVDALIPRLPSFGMSWQF